ncbi:MAG: cytidylate kinase-like family protein [Gemmatimonadota bacterium]
MAIITISRGSLSGGRALAECLSSRLGYPNVGREVLQEAAETLGASEEVFRGKFETTPGLWGRLTHAREKYVLAVQTALAEWCTRGDLVYHGLSGQHLLKGLPGIFRIRLIAPMEIRIKALLESHPMMTVSQAEEFIKDVDLDRSRWVKVMYGADVTDPSLYDLTINLRTHTIESACDTVVTAVAQPRFQITDEVEAEIFAFAAQCRDRLSRAKGG